MHPHRRLIRWLLPLTLLACALSAAAQADPPARVAALSDIEGSVVFAPAGENEWAQAPLNRPITGGDRLWTDPGARADVHLGSAVLHVESEAFVEMRALDESVLHALLHEGVVQARVRALHAGELFEIDTPQLAFRALQPGTYRIDADTTRRITRVTVRDGKATVSGSSGRTLTLYPGQQLQVAGTDLQQIASVSFPDDDFDDWCAERDAPQDHSIAAKHVPLEVVGSAQLDSYGNWSQDPAYGTVWSPGGLPSDWAPYRYGRWQWVPPWGWTWIDDAPWGFAPFHYGRWARIGARWAWVPGRLGHSPVYAPALVSFIGGTSGAAKALGVGETVAWYPLAPGDAWQPFFAASAAYRHRANQSAGGAAARIDPGPLQHRPEAVTALPIEQFRSGEPVQRHWQRTSMHDLSRAQPLLSAAGVQPRPHGGAAPVPSVLPAWTPHQPVAMHAPVPGSWSRPHAGERAARQQRPAASRAWAPPRARAQQEGPRLAPRPSWKRGDGERR